MFERDRGYWWQGDVIYMRWMKKDKVHRVAIAGGGGGCLALYPTDNRDVFSFEIVHEVDDPSTKVAGLRRERLEEDLKTKVMLELLDGKVTRDILRQFQPTPLGEEQNGDSKFSYYFAEAGSEKFDMDYNRHGTFHICPDSEER